MPKQSSPNIDFRRTIKWCPAAAPEVVAALLRKAGQSTGIGDFRIGDWRK